MHEKIKQIGLELKRQELIKYSRLTKLFIALGISSLIELASRQWVYQHYHTSEAGVLSLVAAILLPPTVAGIVFVVFNIAASGCIFYWPLAVYFYNKQKSMTKQIADIQKS